MKIKLNDVELKDCVGGDSLLLITGQINLSNGVNVVTAPQAAIPGALNAFTQIVTKGPGDLANLDIVYVP